MTTIARPRNGGGLDRAVASSLDVVVGVAAIVFPLVYFASDVLEIVQGRFSTTRLGLTYAGEAAIPLFVTGLYVVQRPHIGRAGFAGAVAYAYAYVFFTGTVMYALAAHVRDWSGIRATFGGWLTVHGAIMCAGGLLFGLACWRARVFPRWTALLLVTGVVVVAATAGGSNLVRTIAAAMPDAAFVGMGASLLAIGRSGRTDVGVAREAQRGHSDGRV